MRYYGSIIIFNKYYDKILLIEDKKNHFILPIVENKTNVNINFTTICILNDFFHVKKNINFSYDTFYIQKDCDYFYYIICSIHNECIYIDDSEYFDAKFVDITDIFNKNLLDKNILDNILNINKNNINTDIQKFIKTVPDYYNICNYILYYLRNIKFNSTLDEIYLYIINNKITNISKYDCVISMIFDIKNRIVFKDGIYYCKYRHNKKLLNDFTKYNIFNQLSYEIAYNNKYYLLVSEYFDEYTVINNNIYVNNLEFILINTLDKKITKKIYNKYTKYYEIDIKQCILDDIKFFIVDNNTIITLGHNGMLLSKYIY
jgi:hypothetical protein